MSMYGFYSHGYGDPRDEGDEPPEPPTQEEIDLDASAEIHEELLVRGAYDDIAPPPPGPPCQHDGCGAVLATDGRRWWHRERAHLDADHDAQPCGCDIIAGIVVNEDAWCPLHGAEDALSGAVWADKRTYRRLASDLASHVQ